MKRLVIAATAAALLGGCSTMMQDDMAMGGRTAAGAMAMPTTASA